MRVLKYLVPPEDEGRQLKRVILSRLLISQHQLSRLKSSAGIRVNGAAVHTNYVLHTGDSIALCLEADAENIAERTADAVCADDMELIARLSPSGRADSLRRLAEEIIIYRDEDMLIVNKPAPLPTGAGRKRTSLSLERVLGACFASDWQFRPVNRLDKGTSGLMAVAQTAHAHYRLQAELHTPAFRRLYRAVTEGVPRPERGIVALPIDRAPDSAIKRCVSPQGKPCRTHYETLATCGGKALVSLELETGRTHQIRVHMAALGCPVFGDFLYGRERPDVLPDRFALHSYEILCTQPVTGRTIHFTAPLPPEVSALMSE